MATIRIFFRYPSGDEKGTSPVYMLRCICLALELRPAIEHWRHYVSIYTPVYTAVTSSVYQQCMCGEPKQHVGTVRCALRCALCVLQVYGTYSIHTALPCPFFVFSWKIYQGYSWYSKSKKIDVRRWHLLAYTCIVARPTARITTHNQWSLLTCDFWLSTYVRTLSLFRPVPALCIHLLHIHLLQWGKAEGAKRPRPFFAFRQKSLFIAGRTSIGCQK